MGLIIRTGEGKKLRYLARDLEILKNGRQGISDRIKQSKLPSCVFV